MNIVLRIIIDLLLAAGAFFSLAGTIGILKMPDIFCRMQASTCCTTIPVICLGIAGIIYSAVNMGASTAVKIAVIVMLVLTVNPVGSHAIAKGAYRSGIRGEKEMKIDDFKEDFDE